MGLRSFAFFTLSSLRNRFSQRQSLLILISISFFALVSCSRPQYYKNTFVISGTFLKVTSPNKEASKIVYEEFKRLDKIFNNYDPNSELSKLNNTYKKAVPVSAELLEVLSLSQDVYKLTDGYFDISQGALYDFWKRLISKNKIKRFPSSLEVKQWKERGGMEYITIDKKKGTVTINKEGLKIDLGGIAKGYMVDKAVQKLKQAGIESAIIDAGGDLYCLGKRKNGLWNVGIRDPLIRGGIIHTVALRDEGIATSGNYEQFFLYEGKRYSHLINPKTGYPVRNNVLSVTVVTKNVTTADSLATAFFVMGIDRVKDFLSHHRTTLRIFIVTRKNNKEKFYIF